MQARRQQLFNNQSSMEQVYGAQRAEKQGMAMAGKNSHSHLVNAGKKIIGGGGGGGVGGRGM